MAEFVTHRTDAAERTRASVQLRTAGIGVNHHAVKALSARSIGVFQCFGERPRMGPNSAGTATVCLTLASIDHIDLVHLTIIIPIIPAKIDLVVN